MATALNSKGSDVIPTPQELIDRARAMIPALKARAKQATADWKVPDETIAEMQEAGFFRILQPKRWGGYEMHPNVFFEVQKLLAEGCMSTGWVYGVVGGHPYELALFHDQAQVDVWGEDDSILVSSSYQPVGKVERTEGGFYLSGRWGFSSGSEHCQWVLLGALIPPAEPGGAPDMRTFLVPRTDYVIERTWDVFGLQGTGSHDIVVDRAFVPDYRTHKASDGFMCTNPGQKENDAPLYRLPWAQVFLRLVSSAALGGTRAGINAAVQITKDRVSTNTGKASKSDPVLLNAIAKAYAQLDEMELVLRRNFDDLIAIAESGEPIPMEKRTLYRYQSSSVVRRCADLIDDLMPLLGGRAVYNSSPIVQPWLDLNAARAHVANDPNNMGPDLTNGLLGEGPSFFFL
ncbi:3-hydroxy-9,10-secoandrosta-1,3,5(10)-triene-9,17-dione monooxygenase [Sphingomonas laterariae]|uniref:3-hydroxy-9,10-secoandrosta-1,3,5(10)-triene-9,17-dione monooxygenase n=1 Tax=Edaphosphingomonas laterariae TaxID=861865 RepID=A0A239BKS6_9SPHN|nr:acyl-CoA dehydrogenase family protein [Sphingomonas laterariae]SNS08590.1 3-hydroxy-9,10-secoandrosta-1,3,5(10)-triene-9,17-dione monooxygenase [Sphingomonas laterariae]